MIGYGGGINNIKEPMAELWDVKQRTIQFLE